MKSWDGLAGFSSNCSSGTSIGAAYPLPVRGKPQSIPHLTTLLINLVKDAVKALQNTSFNGLPIVSHNKKKAVQLRALQCAQKGLGI